jgi:chemotaxis signal transduction protein
MAESASEQQSPPRQWAVAPDSGRTVPAGLAAGGRADPALLAVGTGASAEDPTALPPDVPHVGVEFAGARCLLPLGELRGVITDAPRLTRLPFSPRWLLGVFLFGAELLAFVDPIPVLFGRAADEALSQSWPSRAISPRAPTSDHRPIILIGAGDRTLGLRADVVHEMAFVPAATDLRSPEAPGQLPGPIAARYIAATWAPEPSGSALPVLAVAPLLDDLLRLLTEEGRDG